MKEIRDSLSRKKCSKCKTWKYPNEYWKRNKLKSGLTSECKECTKEYQKEFYARPGIAKRAQEAKKKRIIKTKITILRKYGNKCKKCGFSDYRALHIVRIDGEERKELQKHYSNVESYFNMIKKDGLEKYQLVCANCKRIKEFERKGSYAWS